MKEVQKVCYAGDKRQRKGSTCSNNEIKKNTEHLSHARRASSIGRSGSGLSPAAGQPLLLAPGLPLCESGFEDEEEERAWVGPLGGGQGAALPNARPFVEEGWPPRERARVARAKSSTAEFVDNEAAVVDSMALKSRWLEPSLLAEPTSWLFTKL